MRRRGRTKHGVCGTCGHGEEWVNGEGVCQYGASLSPLYRACGCTVLKRNGLEALAKRVDAAIAELVAVRDELRNKRRPTSASEAATATAKAVQKGLDEGLRTKPKPNGLVVTNPPTKGDLEAALSGAAHTTSFEGALSSGARAVLVAIVQGFHEVRSLVVVTGYAERTIRNLLTELSSRGLVTRESGAAFQTPEGQKLVTSEELANRPKHDELITRWRVALGVSEARVLNVVIAKKVVTVGEIADELRHDGRESLAERTVRNLLTELSRNHLVKRSHGKAILVRELGGAA